MSHGFDLVDLRLFLHVIESGSITAGAGSAHLALASASARIRGMEQRLGTPLLLRERRGVRGTAAGCALAGHARLLLQQEQRMRGELRQYAQGLRAHVRLLGNTAAVAEFLPEALGAFLVAHPDVDIDLQQQQSVDIVQALTRGEADLGIIADSADSGLLQVFPFRHDRLVAVLPPEHPLRARDSLSLSDLLPCDFIGLAAGNALHEHLESHAAQLGARLRYRLRVHGLDAVCRLVADGAGVGVVSETAARRFDGALGYRPLRERWAWRQLLICMRELDGLPAHARELVAHLRSSAEGEQGGAASRR